jgi:TonB family protein
MPTTKDRAVVGQIRDALARSTTLNPAFAPSYAVLTQVALQLGDRDEALAQAVKAVTHAPNVFAYRMSFARTLVGTGRRDRAQVEAQTALELARNDAERHTAQELIDTLKAPPPTQAGTGAGAGASAAGAAAPPAGVLKPGNGVSAPRLIKEVKPSYTRAALEAGIQGAVLLEGVVQPDGALHSLRVVRSLDSTYGLDDQAVRAASQWLFAPGTKEGAPVPVLITIELSFTLKGSEK